MKYESGIAAIALVVMVVIILLTLMGGLVLLTTTGYKSYQFSKDRAQALYLAEAGISSAIREIKGDGYLPGDEYLPVNYDGGEIELIPQTSLGDGSYSVRCTAAMPSRGGSEHGSLGKFDSVDHYQYQLTSTGEINGVEREVQATYKVTIDIEEFKLEHKAFYTSSCNIAGAYQTPVIPVPLMEFFWDNANYKYTPGGEEVLSGNLEGIYYVKGDAKLSAGTELKGTIVVEGGTLTVEQPCEIKKSDTSNQDFPVIVVYSETETGNVIILGELSEEVSEINGLIYASNSVTIQENCEIKGVIIADKITVGDSEIKYEEVFPPGFWGGTSASGGTTRKVSLEPETWQSS